VIHGFIDGFSRFVLGLRASGNNRAETVLQLFEDITTVYGYPVRARGDHGTENLLVAFRMEVVRGLNRGSYIWGRLVNKPDYLHLHSQIFRSVHNIRIERLWVDMTAGIGSKWREFLQLLEVHDGLDVDNDTHVWLLHYLFLPRLNQDLDSWIGAWNNHTLARRGQPHCTPTQLYLHGQIENGIRGIFPEPPDNADADYADYGIDWDDIDNRRIHDHHHLHNPDDGNLRDPLAANTPEHLSHVYVPDARCPFDETQLARLGAFLSSLPYFNNNDTGSNRSLWIEALHFATNMLL
jgi:hypothetical protein